MNITEKELNEATEFAKNELLEQAKYAAEERGMKDPDKVAKSYVDGFTFKDIEEITECEADHIDDIEELADYLLWKVLVIDGLYHYWTFSEFETSYVDEINQEIELYA